jgi:hypothetical protein
MWWKGRQLKNAIKKQIREESQVEALLILLQAGDEAQDEFLKYHREDSGNVCCMVLDKWKDKLVEQGLMRVGGDFGDNQDFKV